MPITPFHFGLGAAIKASAPRAFSFSVFCFTQVVADTEVVCNVLLDRFPLHRFLHTYLGATLVALIGIVIGRPLCAALKRLWNGRLDAQLTKHLALPARISLLAASTGAFFGAYSHVLLDSIMHADMQPFAPFGSTNAMLGVLTFSQLHL